MTARVLWEGKLCLEHVAALVDKTQAGGVYRVVSIPPSARLEVEERRADKLGAVSWRDVEGARVTMVLETAILALVEGPKVALKPDAPESALRGPLAGSGPTDGPPKDELLVFKSGEFAGKKLSDLEEAHFKKLIPGYRQMVLDAQSSVAQASATEWLTKLLAWASYRGLALGRG